jgi:hypothetical protein
MRSEYQFSDQEIQSAIDWRYRDILRKAHAYDRMKAEAGKPGKAPIVISGRRNRNSQTAEERRYGEILAAAKKPNSSKEVKVAAAKAALERAFANKR